MYLKRGKSFESFCLLFSHKILFGKDMEREVGCEIAAHGGSRVLLVYGGGSARKSGLLDRVKSALASEGISFWCLGNIQPNPLLERVYDGIELIREKKLILCWL